MRGVHHSKSAAGFRERFEHAREEAMHTPGAQRDYPFERMYSVDPRLNHGHSAYRRGDPPTSLTLHISGERLMIEKVSTVETNELSLGRGRDASGVMMQTVSYHGERIEMPTDGSLHTLFATVKNKSAPRDHSHHLKLELTSRPSGGSGSGGPLMIGGNIAVSPSGLDGVPGLPPLGLSIDGHPAVPFSGDASMPPVWLPRTANDCRIVPLGPSPLAVPEIDILIQPTGNKQTILRVSTTTTTTTISASYDQHYGPQHIPPSSSFVVEIKDEASGMPLAGGEISAQAVLPGDRSHLVQVTVRSGGYGGPVCLRQRINVPATFAFSGASQAPPVVSSGGGPVALAVQLDDDASGTTRRALVTPSPNSPVAGLRVSLDNGQTWGRSGDWVSGPIPPGGQRGTCLIQTDPSGAPRSMGAVDLRISLPTSSSPAASLLADFVDRTAKALNAQPPADPKSLVAAITPPTQEASNLLEALRRMLNAPRPQFELTRTNSGQLVNMRCPGYSLYFGEPRSVLLPGTPIQLPPTGATVPIYAVDASGSLQGTLVFTDAGLGGAPAAKKTAWRLTEAEPNVFNNISCEGAARVIAIGDDGRENEVALMASLQLTPGTRKLLRALDEKGNPLSECELTSAHRAPAPAIAQCSCPDADFMRRLADVFRHHNHPAQTGATYRPSVGQDVALLQPGSDAGRGVKQGTMLLCQGTPDISVKVVNTVGTADLKFDVVADGIIKGRTGGATSDSAASSIAIPSTARDVTLRGVEGSFSPPQQPTTSADTSSIIPRLASAFQANKNDPKRLEEEWSKLKQPAVAPPAKAASDNNWLIDLLIHLMRVPTVKFTVSADGKMTQTQGAIGGDAAEVQVSSGQNAPWLRNVTPDTAVQISQGIVGLRVCDAAQTSPIVGWTRCQAEMRCPSSLFDGSNQSIILSKSPLVQQQQPVSAMNCSMSYRNAAATGRTIFEYDAPPNVLLHMTLDGVLVENGAPQRIRRELTGDARHRVMIQGRSGTSSLSSSNGQEAPLFQFELDLPRLCHPPLQVALEKNEVGVTIPLGAAASGGMIMNNSSKVTAIVDHHHESVVDRPISLNYNAPHVVTLRQYTAEASAKTTEVTMQLPIFVDAAELAEVVRLYGAYLAATTNPTSVSYILNSIRDIGVRTKSDYMRQLALLLCQGLHDALNHNMVVAYCEKVIDAINTSGNRRTIAFRLDGVPSA